MTDDSLNYPLLIDHAMRGVVRDVLRQVSAHGLPGQHHFFISYDTTHPGVKMSDVLRAKYPRDITIVLQHQFWDFRVEDHQFHATLSFGGVPEKLTVPFAAITAFADPSVQFGLQFQPLDTAGETAEPSAQPMAVMVEAIAPDDAGSAEVISLDAFRKK